MTSRPVLLERHFNQVTADRKTIETPANGNLFLESIYSQQDSAICVERLLASTAGLKEFRKSLKLDASPKFLNGAFAKLLCFLATSELKTLYNGQHLHAILDAVIDPPTLWNALVDASQEKILDQIAQQGLAWLTLGLLQKDGGPASLRSVAQAFTDEKVFTEHSSPDIRALGQDISRVLLTTTVHSSFKDAYGPGGRHDNDFEDFRDIAILPTGDELASTKAPFLRRSDAIVDVNCENRNSVHLDNQFRLLRADMLHQLRADVQGAQDTFQDTSKSKVKLSLDHLELQGVEVGERRWHLCCLTFKISQGIPRLRKMSQSKREKFIKQNRHFVAHNSIGYLFSDAEFLAVGTVHRDEKLLADEVPSVVIQISEGIPLTKVLLATKSLRNLSFVSIETPLFAYEPILRCLQNKVALPLSEEILDCDFSCGIGPSRIAALLNLVQDVEENGEECIDRLLATETPKTPIRLDSSQLQSFLSGLGQSVSLIQGPPGTGKSFIGALLAKAIFMHTSEKILVVCYTNHALDQFLEDLLEIGGPSSQMVRLGFECTQKTEKLRLQVQSATYRRQQDSWKIIDQLQKQADMYSKELSAALEAYRTQSVGRTEVMEYLEFSEDDFNIKLFEAFTLPDTDDNQFQIVGEDGKAIDRFYLYDRWRRGQDAGVLQSQMASLHPRAWALEKSVRERLLEEWALQIFEARLSHIQYLVARYNKCVTKLGNIFAEKEASIIRDKRIVGCTTTGAAMKTKEMQNTSPGVLLVEEAGEILESHTLACLTPTVKQLILIGDHQQLRPKISNYKLSVEIGEGYDLNQSMFERLVRADFPHTTLSTQHRMVPEISTLVRRLTYPTLVDAPKTKERARLRGLRDRVTFLHHEHTESSVGSIQETRDLGLKTTKQNIHEAAMVIRCVRYLGQQGYGTSEIVVLTPYLGQLHLIMDFLQESLDPVLNDVDSFEMIRAGLMPPGTSQPSRPKIRLATIDAYQGEESDIVIVSLTRSNASGEVGFLASPERVNVLLSRAQNALIVFGNLNTFQESRRAEKAWRPLLEMLKEDKHVYDGLPVQCEQHPDRQAVLKNEEDFDKECPDGGCSEPCGTMLSCGLHVCPHSCHQLSDHSKMECAYPLSTTCPKGCSGRHQGQDSRTTPTRAR